MSISDLSKLSLYQNISKYIFNLENYLFRPTWDATRDVETTPETNGQPVIEALKKFHLPVEPSVQLWQIFTDDDIARLKSTKGPTARRSLIQKRIKRCFGVPKLLITIFIDDLLKFCDRNGFDGRKTKAMLSICLRTHQYFVYRSGSTPDELYDVFKRYLFFHNVNHAPSRVKTFSVYDCSRIVTYFCTNYLRFVPLISCLMLPNFALILRIDEAWNGRVEKK